MSHLDTMRHLETPFSYQFYEAIGNLERTLAVGITSVRDAGGADLGIKKAVADGLIRGPRLQISLGMTRRRAATAIRGSLPAARCPSSWTTRAVRPRSSTGPTRCAGRSVP